MSYLFCTRYTIEIMNAVDNCHVLLHNTCISVNHVSLSYSSLLQALMQTPQVKGHVHNVGKVTIVQQAKSYHVTQVTLAMLGLQLVCLVPLDIGVLVPHCLLNV